MRDVKSDIGANSSTAESIFNKMDEAFVNNDIIWDKCVGTGVHNTSVNLAIRNSIRTRVLQKNASFYFMGCPCHIVHNTALKAANSFTQVDMYTINSSFHFL